MGEEEDVAVGVHLLGCSGKCHVIVVTNCLHNRYHSIFHLQYYLPLPGE